MVAGPPKIRGRPSWVTGSKLAFLNRYAEEWQKAVDTSPLIAGQFYTRVTKRFIKQYGFFFDRWLGSENIELLDNEALDEEESQEGLSQEDVIKRHAYYIDLREVSLRTNCLLWNRVLTSTPSIRPSCLGTTTTSTKSLPNRRALS